jgi:hypothetical protein
VYNEKAAAIADFTLETKHNVNYIEIEEIKDNLSKIDKRM